MVKRSFDVLLSAMALLGLSPILASIALTIRRGSPGPVFYRGVRVGHHGRLFQILKFRTMVVNAERLGGPSTSDDDPRITPVGRWLRKYKLDELPQLINVLKGEMSFVGPRPEVQQYVNLYTEEEKAILTVRPGLTDFATLWNVDEGAVLAGSSDPERTYLEEIRPEKIRRQLEYVRCRSFAVDLAIICRTLASILLRTKPEAMSVLQQRPDQTKASSAYPARHP